MDTVYKIKPIVFRIKKRILFILLESSDRLNMKLSLLLTIIIY